MSTSIFLVKKFTPPFQQPTFMVEVSIMFYSMPTELQNVLKIVYIVAY